MKDAVKNLLAAWDSVTPANIFHGWKNLTPNLCPDSSSTTAAASSLAEVVAAACELPGFQDVTEEEISELQASDTSDVTADITDTVVLEDNHLKSQQQRGREEQEE